MTDSSNQRLLDLSGVTLSNRLDIAALQVNQGECIHLIGPNGAGKSSLLLVMAGLIAPDSGSLLMMGKPISQWSLASLATMRTILAQHAHVNFHLSVKEYLSFYSDLSEWRGIPPLLDKALEVSSFMTKMVTHLSGGERQRVEICRTLMQIWPQLVKGEGVVLLDEPLQGLDIRHQYALAQLANVLSEKGNTVIVSSHDIKLSANYSDRLWLMHEGKVVADGNPSQVVTQANLERIFECHFAISKHDNFLEIQVCAPISLE
ncbi:vitamin B12 ABC transporter ATP-binding protein BtuD [Alteromonas sp. D210916BOD_24]|uniref:ATP-binding cassette domain-containing protein n=1 Tax=Alteromonas sp. D210916BOD_24 TaxID=3157618 RepID=UPI00399D05D4